MSCDNFKNHQCASCNRESIISAEENKKIYKFFNTNKSLVCKIIIDNCYIVQGERCDYLILDCENRKAIFIELKGKNISKACSQIIATILWTKNTIINFSIYARIIVSKYSHPNISNDPRRLRLKRICRENSGNLIIKERLYTENT